MPIINKTSIQQVVPIILANGKKDTVNLQPNGRLTLPAGAQLDPTKARQFSGTLLDTDAAANAQTVARASAVGTPKDKPSNGGGGQARATVQINGAPEAQAPAKENGSGSNQGSNSGSGGGGGEHRGSHNNKNN